MVRTRKQRSLSRRRRRTYRMRAKNSPCKGKGPAVCRAKPGCKYSSGRKRSFCRKSQNKKLSSQTI